MITAKMNGRRLELTVESEPGEEAIAPFLVAPLSAHDGRAMSVRYLLTSEGLPHDGPTLAADLVTAFGAENYDRADVELHGDVTGVLTQAAFYWQTLGGMTAVRALLEVDARDEGEQAGEVARGKALTVLRSRLVPLLHETRRLLESEHRTAGASTPATATPAGGEKPEPEPSRTPIDEQQPTTPPAPSTPSPDGSPPTSD